MAGNLSLRALYEPQRTKLFSAITAGYSFVGTINLEMLDHPIRQFLIQNLTDAALQFSFDGVNDHFPMPANSFYLNDICSNNAFDQGFYISKGTTLYVKQLEVPTTGSVYFTVMYGKD